MPVDRGQDQDSGLADWITLTDKTAATRSIYGSPEVCQPSKKFLMKFDALPQATKADC